MADRRTSEREHLASMGCWCRPIVESYGSEHDDAEEDEGYVCLLCDETGAHVHTEAKR